jgi:hypothetical protein
LSLKVVYLWRHVSSTAPPFILWWSNLEILFGPLHRRSPFIGESTVKQFKWNTVLYSRENPKRSLHILWDVCVCDWCFKNKDVRQSRRCQTWFPLEKSECTVIDVFLKENLQGYNKNTPLLHLPTVLCTGRGRVSCGSFFIPKLWVWLWLWSSED